MLLSRVFSLLLGTTLFVMIWTMQDGNHAALRLEMAVSVRSIPQRHESPVAVTVCEPVSQHVAVSAAEVQVPSENTLWIFADEPPEQFAAK